MTNLTRRQVINLLTDVRDRRANLRGHACPGFDCATCEPSRDIEEIEQALAAITSEGVPKDPTP